MTTSRDPCDGRRPLVRPDDAIVPPWKRLHRDIASSGPLRRSGLEGIGVFVMLMAVCDARGRLPGTAGDTVAQTVGAAIGFPPETVERPLRALLQRELLLPHGPSGVRFSPAAWARRQNLQSFGQDDEGATLADTPSPSFAAAPAADSDPLDRTDPREPLEFQGKRPPMPGVERVDRLRYNEVERGTPATGRHRHYPHPPGMPFEVWLSTDPTGVRILLHRRKDHPTYALGVTPAGNVTAPVTETPGNAPVTTGNVTAALPVREIGMVLSGKEEKREDVNVTARDRVTLPQGGNGVTQVTPNDDAGQTMDLPEIPSLASVDDPHIATNQKLREGNRVLRALIDRACAERRGAVIELGARPDAMRYAAMRLQNAGVRFEGDTMEKGVRVFDALVSLLRDPVAMRRVLGKWKNVKAAGFALPMDVCAHNQGQAMQQLIAEAQKIVATRETQGPFLPLETPRATEPPVDGDVIVYELDASLQLVEKARVSGSGVRS